MKVAASWLLPFLVLGTSAVAGERVHTWDVSGMKNIAAQEGFTFEVGESWVTDYLENGGDIKNITGLVKPEKLDLNANYVNLQADEDLPAQFDWRTMVEGGLQPIRNQGQCGSCWAFSITAVIEALQVIAHPGQVSDLAEQSLVSCSQDSYGCNGGYFDSFNYVKSPGMPAEADFPYQASNMRCRSNLTPAKKISSWAYIVSDNGGTPSIEQMKTAIMKYGPISVDVDASFGSYKSGVFNYCQNGQINHMVTLEGWDDATQSWIMRNSWGASWGENGYMRIKYTDRNGHKCNNIGETAAFAVLDQSTLN